MHKAQVQITTPLHGNHKQQVYISYNKTYDRPVAVGLFNCLQRYDVQSFLDMPPGVSWEHMLKNDYKRVDIMLLVVTQRSLDEIAAETDHPLLLDYEQALLAAERDDVGEAGLPLFNPLLNPGSTLVQPWLNPGIVPRYPGYPNQPRIDPGVTLTRPLAQHLSQPSSPSSTLISLLNPHLTRPLRNSGSALEPLLPE